jgi:hypothetical protein
VDATAISQAEFEAKKSEAEKIIYVDLKNIASADDFNKLPVDNETDFKDGKIQEAERWIINNALEKADIQLPASWRIESNTKTGYYSMGYDFIQEGNTKTFRVVSAFFINSDTGQKMLRLGVEFGGSGQLIHINLENPEWWNDSIRIDTLIALFNRNPKVALLPVFGYGTVGDWTRQINGYINGEDSSKEINTIAFQSAHFAEFQELATKWVKDRKLPDGADQFLFGSYLEVYWW